MKEVLRPGCYAVGDGIDWNLREGAGIYDMTVSVNAINLDFSYIYVFFAHRSNSCCRRRTSVSERDSTK